MEIPIYEFVKFLIGAWLLQTSNQECIEDVDESKPYIQLDLFTGVSDNPAFGQTGSVADEQADTGHGAQRPSMIEVVEPEDKDNKS